MLPKESEKKELYLIRTVPVGPTDATIGDGPGNKGWFIKGIPTIGLPKANDLNRSVGLQLIALGKEGDDEFRFLDFEGKQLKLAIEETGSVSPYKNGISSEIPKFSIEYGVDTSPRALDISWNFVAETVPTVLSETYSFHSASRAVFVEDEETNILYKCIIGKIVGQTDYRVLVLSYDQNVSAIPSFTVVGYSDKLSVVGIADLVNPNIAICKNGDIIYILISHYGDGTVTAYGELHLLSFNTRSTVDPKVTLIKKDIAESTGGLNQKFDGGISIEHAFGRLVISAGIRDRAVSDATAYRRDVLVGSSPDGIHWSFTDGITNALGIVSSADSLFSVDGVQAIDFYESSDAPLLAAVANGGKIFVSSDVGKTWKEKTSFASRNSIDLTAVKIIRTSSLEKHVIYVGGKGGFVMRSTDAGETWKVVGAPDQFYPWRDLPDTDNLVINPIFGVYDYSTNDFEVGADGKPIYTEIDSLGSGNVTTEGNNTIIEIEYSYYNKDDITGGNLLAYNIFLITKKTVTVIKNAEKITFLDKTAGSGDIAKITSFGDIATSATSVITGGAVIDRTLESPSLLLTGRFVKEEGASATSSGGFQASNGYLTNVHHFCRIIDAKNPKTGAYKSNQTGFYFSTDEQDINIPYTSPVIASDSLAYAVTREGNLLSWHPDDATTHLVAGANVPTSRDVASIVKDSNDVKINISSAGLTSIGIFKDKTTASDITMITVGSPDGFVYRSFDGGQQWDTISVGKITTLKNTILSLIPFSIENILVGGSVGIYTTIQRNRMFPKLYKNQSGTLLFLGMDNLDLGYVEMWRTDEFSLSENSLIPVFSHIYPATNAEGNENVRIQFTVPTSLQNISTDVPQISLFETENTLFIFTPGKVVATVDDCTNVFSPIASRVPLPVNAQLTINGTWDGAQHRATASVYRYGGNRLIASATSTDAKLGVWQCRTWERTDADRQRYFYAPVINGQWTWSGLGSLKLKWLGSPSRGDSFTLSVEYQFGFENLSIESPSFQYRIGPDDKISDALRRFPIHMYWNRKDPVIQKILGKGDAWNVNACGLIKTNYPDAEWAISTPYYTGDTFPTDLKDYTTFPMTAIVKQGTFSPQTAVAQAVPGQQLAKNIITDPSQNFTPNEFASGMRNWYLIAAKTSHGISDTTPGNTEIRKIVGNTGQSIIYEGDPIFTKMDDLEGIFEYAVYGDRMFSDGNGGTRTDLYNNPEPPLAGTEYEFGQWLRLTIPHYHTVPENYHITSSVIFGRLNEISIPLNSGVKTRHRFSRGWRWTMIPHVTHEETAEGVSYQKAYAPPTQAFRLQWDNVDAWEVEVFYNLLMPDIHQAFCIIFDADDNSSIELVRIRDQVDVDQAFGRIFSHGVTLYEVK